MVNPNMYIDIKAMHPEVTGSHLVCEVRLPSKENINFAVDCGLFQEEKYSTLNKTLGIDPKKLDFVLVTHTHIDHVGRLPLLTKNGFTGKIYISDIASELIVPALDNTLQILSQETQKQQKSNNTPIFDADDLSQTLNLLEPVEFYKTFNVHKNIRVRFLKNPHILGAALIELHIHYPNCEPIKLLFTGDYSKSNTFFATRKLPKSLRESNLTIVQESTYGSTQSTEIEKTFDTNISNAIKKGNTVVIPVFALERAQLIMLRLKQLQDEGLLDKSIPIYLDGELAIRYTKIYNKLKDMFFRVSRDFFPENFSFVKSQDMRISLMEMSHQKIILTTSGMGGWGPAQLYLPYFAQMKKCLIQFPGYVSECSLGRKLIDAKIGEEVVLCDGKRFIKRCDVQQTSEFSSHAKADDLIEFDNQLLKLQTVLINHGPEAAQIEFENKVKKETNAKKVSRLKKNLVHRIGPYGLIKTLENT